MLFLGVDGEHLMKHIPDQTLSAQQWRRLLISFGWEYSLSLCLSMFCVLVSKEFVFIILYRDIIFMEMCLFASWKVWGLNHSVWVEGKQKWYWRRKMDRWYGGRDLGRLGDEWQQTLCCIWKKQVHTKHAWGLSACVCACATSMLKVRW